ncbi:MAG: prepilin peptidase [Bryobacterales bacterium]|nr:prepilin peptidase [Bryobacterales bacterium]
MTAVLAPQQWLLAALVLAAAVFDVRTHKIPNALNLAGTLAGLAAGLALNGIAGLKRAGLGFALGFAVYFAMYLLRAMGAGDVKLMAAVGSIVGPGNWFAVFILTSVLGGVLALALVIHKGRLSRTLWNIWFLVRDLARLRSPARNPELDVRSEESVKLEHAVSIALGSLAFLYLSTR